MNDDEMYRKLETNKQTNSNIVCCMCCLCLFDSGAGTDCTSCPGCLFRNGLIGFPLIFQVMFSNGFLLYFSANFLVWQPPVYTCHTRILAIKNFKNYEICIIYELWIEKRGTFCELFYIQIENNGKNVPLMKMNDDEMYRKLETNKQTNFNIVCCMSCLCLFDSGAGTDCTSRPGCLFRNGLIGPPTPTLVRFGYWGSTKWRIYGGRYPPSATCCFVIIEIVTLVKLS